MKPHLLLLFALPAPAFAAELVPARIPATAKWQLHLDLDAARTSEIGKLIFSQIETEHGAKLQGLKRISGVHLLDDVHDVTFFGDGKPEHAVVLLNANFDKGHLVDVVKAADGYHAEVHGGITIHEWTDKDEPQFAAFASDQLLVFSRQGPAVKEELDLLQSPPVSGAAALANTAPPLMSASANLSEIELPEDVSKILKLATKVKVSATEAKGRFGLQVEAASQDAEHAKRLVRMIDGLIALAESGEVANQPASLQSDVQVTVDQPGVVLSISAPVDMTARLLREAAEKAKPTE